MHEHKAWRDQASWDINDKAYSIMQRLKQNTCVIEEEAWRLPIVRDCVAPFVANLCAPSGIQHCRPQQVVHCLWPMSAQRRNHSLPLDCTWCTRWREVARAPPKPCPAAPSTFRLRGHAMFSKHTRWMLCREMHMRDLISKMFTAHHMYTAVCDRHLHCGEPIEEVKSATDGLLHSARITL